MTNRVGKTIARWGMVKPGERVLCALSGGGDSVCLTHILRRLQKTLDITVAAAHFTHGLRPEHAEEERKLCEDMCRRLEIPFFSGEGDTLAYASEQHIGKEEAARELRYRFLADVSVKWGAQKIATGHNQGDNAETVLFNLIRGTGLDGLKGIPPVRGNLIRPLLECSRHEIAQYLQQWDLPFVIDQSNMDQNMARSRIRYGVIPQLELINPSAVSNICRSASHVEEARSFMQSSEQAVLKQAQAINGRITAPAGLFAQSPPAARCLPELYLRAGGQKALSGRQIESLMRLCENPRPSARVSLPDGIVARREYALIVFEKEEKADLLPDMPVTPGLSAVWGDYTVRAGKVATDAPPDCWQWHFSLAELEGPVILRSRRSGDMAITAGGTKTLKKLMIELKIPMVLRDRLPILCDNKGVLAAPLKNFLPRGLCDVNCLDFLEITIGRKLG